MFRFVIVLIVGLTLVLGVLEILIFKSLISERPSYYIESLALLVITTAVLFRYLNKTPQESFVQMFLLLMVVKLIVFFGYLLVILISDKAGAIPNAVFFLASYFLFTAIEIGFLFRKVTR